MPSMGLTLWGEIPLSESSAFATLPLTISRKQKPHSNFRNRSSIDPCSQGCNPRCEPLGGEWGQFEVAPK